ncbi:sucrase-isomaltase, intestinal-like isoform X2 [Dreissena polymorpha]|uniref:sucrase-isomaltase, intestinal-like isoform X2 n=1 Tax=Dreissena polymorpha TaxID=45954 RepID=UPI00226427E2|nr:sucrase-isomaltase, intestinal-like isoform X2 [Dreissena polymorpha]
MEQENVKKFHSFDQSEIVGENYKSRRSNRERYVWIFLVLALIAAVIGVSIYFSKNYEKKGSSESGSSGAQTGDVASTTAPKPTSTASGIVTTKQSTDTVQSTSTSGTIVPSTTVPPTEDELRRRIECIPEAQGGVVKATPELCDKRGCIYSQSNKKGVPDCYFSQEIGYKVNGVSNTALGFRADLVKKKEGPFGDDLEKAVFVVEMLGDDIIHFKFDDPVFHRYKVPLDLNLPTVKGDNTKYRFKITNNETFAFQIIRKSTDKVLWDTGVGGLVLSDQFLQISTSLPSENVYGFGENMHTTFRHNLNYKTWPMFARDQPPSHDADFQEANLYGVHPFYMCMEEGGYSHGVFLLNSNAMDYSFTPLPMLTYRTIGGILDFYMFLGPEPENVVQQYTGLIGRPFMPPYYALGFQLCRYGYKNVDDMEAALNRTLQYKIPLDIQYGDIDHFDANMDFTLDHVKFGRLPQYFRDLQSKGMKTVIILDPAIISNVTGYQPYVNLTAVRGSVMWPEDLNVAIEDKDSTGALLGYVWPSGKSVFPDFFKKETQEVWTNLIVQHHNLVPFDALWIDMNEPANFGTNLERPWNWPETAKPYWSLHCPTNSKLEDPPYRTKAGYHFDKDGKETRLSDKTICMASRQGENGKYRHYDVHNLYGWSQTLPTLKGARSATGERSFVLSRSTYPGSGKYSGHWLGDNDSKWSDMHASIIGMLEFNLFGIPYIGADICGYWGNTTPEMCKRWQQVGAFYPFSRNHNQMDSMDQDPGIWPEVGYATREAMETRYWLLPYLYTLFHKAHTYGGTVVRPVFHEFPKDTHLYDLDRQFMWGNALMIVPILEQGAAQVYFTLPEGVWYDFYDHIPHNGPDYNMRRTVDANSKIGLFVRGGTILPMQKPENNTHFSRKNPFKLLVALDASNTAEGEMFWDDGNSVDTAEKGNYFFANFKAEMNHLAMTIQHSNIPQLDTTFFGSVEVINAPSGVKRVYCDGENFNFTYSGQTLVITDFRLPLTRDFKIYWSTESDDERTRHDCIPEAQGPGVKVTEQLCTQRGCVYNPNASQGPKCYFNLDNYGYRVSNWIETDLGFVYQLQRKTRPSPFSDQGNPDIQTLNFTIEMRSRDVLRFKFDDARGGRYEVPSTLNLGSDKALDPRYEVKVTSNDPFAFQVVRRSNGEILWDTGVGGLTFSDHYLHISTRLPSRNIYGFGENIHHSLRHDLNYRAWPLFARDQPTSWGDYLNHYGVHPFYMCVEDTVNGGHSHGVLLLNSNAQDYSFTPLPMLTYRTIGGILDFYMFLGPEPENVVQQYTGAIGRPYMPPYWALGFQLCRYGYNNISNLQDAVEKTRIANIPHDVQYVDIDHMYEQRDFTLNNKDFPGLNDYFKKLQSDGMHIIIMMDPTLISNVSGYEPYIRMHETNSNIKWDPKLYIPSESVNDKNDILGYVWPVGKVVFPDFFKNSTKQVWKELIVKHHNHNLTFDGLWIDMNEPANFGTNEERPFNWPEGVKPYWSLNCTLEGNYYEHPPYRTMAAFVHDSPNNLKMISEKTICMRALQGENGEFKHYDVHNLYGWSQTQPTLDAVRAATGERSIVITRSTFPGSGKYGGHWLGDNNSVWKELQRSIIGSLEFNFFGIPYIGADICGFMVDTTPELCKRWMQLGAFYTFSRNHNGINYLRQDPGSFAPETGVAEASRIAMETRYWLLPYLYTLFHHAHVRGNTVIRPLHHEFADDVVTFDIDKQFLWGPALMISPILYEGQSAINLYMPRGPWYDWYTGEEFRSQGYIRRPVEPDSPIPLHVRAGHILPLQRYANNTHFSRRNPFTLLVALKDSENGGRGYVADGDLFWDDGDSVDTYETDHYYYARFSSMSNKLHLTVEHNTAGSSMDGLHIGSVKVIGVRSNVKVIYIGNTTHTDLKYDPTKMVLEVNNLQLPLTTEFTLEWREYRKPTQGEMDRLSCYPEFTNQHVTEPMCRNRSCIYDASNTLPFIPSCYFNRTAYGYFRLPAEPNVVKLNKRTAGTTTMFGKDIFALLVQIEHLTDSILHIKIVDEPNKRYNVPLPLQMIEKNNSTDTLYNIILPQDNTAIEFTMKITRKSTGKKIWDTSAGPLIFSEQFLQLSTYLASDNLYGLGEHRHMHLKHDMDYRTWPIFTRDAAVNSPDYTNLYGAHPFYMNIEDDDGNTHGVFFLNSNAMEILLDPNPRLTYRTIGGVLDFYFFMGPSPESVVQQYQQLIGTPVLVPYWALGFQLSRWGYNSLDNLKVAVERTQAAGIPHDIQYADIDHMDERKDFTYDAATFAGLPEYIQELQAGGMHFIIILDPALVSNVTGYLPYETGVTRDVFIKWPPGKGPADSRPNGTSDIMLGYLWPKGKTAFPDFLLNETQDWWADTIEEWHKTIKFDGLWIDMNEPSNFDTNGMRPWNWPEKDTPYWTLKCTLDNNTWDLPPYRPRSLLGDVLSDKTLCMIGEQRKGTFRHYDVHSLYGWSQTQPTSIGLQRATGRRGIVISRSTYPSSGHYGGHWLGDNDSFWRNLHDSIIGIIEFNLFGIPYIGADICGFFSEPSVEMCQRWMQLGAFYTFSRNHNGLNMKEQDPSVFGPHMSDSSKRAMEIRYSLLPFLYTQFYRVHTQGGTVIRSMFHNFPKDPRTRSIDTQFMWGDSFLIAPVVEQGHLHKDVYLPAARWFDHYTGAEVKEHGTTVTVNAPRDHIPLFWRGGYIIPTQKPANNTVFSRKNTLGLTVIPDNNGTATGDLFWDDGDSIGTIETKQYYFASFNFRNNTVSMSVDTNHTVVEGLVFDEVWVLGMTSRPSSVTAGGTTLGFTYYTDTRVLHIHGLSLPLKNNFSITWN